MRNCLKVDVEESRFLALPSNSLLKQAKHFQEYCKLNHTFDHLNMKEIKNNDEHFIWKHTRKQKNVGMNSKHLAKIEIYTISEATLVHVHIIGNEFRHRKSCCNKSYSNLAEAILLSKSIFNSLTQEKVSQAIWKTLQVNSHERFILTISKHLSVEEHSYNITIKAIFNDISISVTLKSTSWNCQHIKFK